MSEQRERDLDAIEALVRTAVSAQREDADPDHGDWYAWGWTLTDLTAQLAHLCRVLDRQAARYGDRRILRDDEGMDPARRVAEIQRHAANLAEQLDYANATARRLHAEIGHIAVEVDPDAPAGVER